MGLVTKGDCTPKKYWPKKWPKTFSVYNRIEEVRDACDGATREDTLCVLDGNVLMQQVPQHLTSYEDYVRLLVQQIQYAINTAMTVVVVFDEPENLTKAKVKEQASRDERKVMSSDLTVCPQDDSYLLSDIELEGVDCHDLVLNRKTRSRFFDGVCCEALKQFDTIAMQISTTTLTFDGIDKRGWDRPFGTTRNVGIVTSDKSGLIDKILTRTHPVGEGDLKLCDVPHRFHVSRTNGIWPDNPILLNILQTVDTDSLLIELMQQAKRAQKPDEVHEKTVLCFREPPRKATKNHDARGKCFFCCDIESLYFNVTEFMFEGMENVPTLIKEIPGIERVAVLTFSLGVLMVHTDFVEVAGTRLDHMMEAARAVFQEDPDTAALTRCALSTDAHESIRISEAADAILDCFCETVFDIGTKVTKASRDKAKNTSHLGIKQAAWNLCYWSHREYTNIGFWGFSVDTPTEPASHIE